MGAFVTWSISRFADGSRSLLTCSCCCAVHDGHLGNSSDREHSCGHDQIPCYKYGKIPSQTNRVLYHLRSCPRVFVPTRKHLDNGSCATRRTNSPVSPQWSAVIYLQCGIRGDWIAMVRKTRSIMSRVEAGSFTTCR